MTNDLYQEVILEEYKHPQNSGKLQDADIVLQERNASCGDSVTIYLKLDADKKKIIDVKWQGVGCAISMAAMSVLSERLKQLTVDEIVKLERKQMEEMLGLDEIAEGRVKCLTLGLVTVQKKF